MDHWLPFLQTLLWVVLIGGIVWRFNRPIHGLLTALQKRVEAGSGVKAGPFELSPAVRVQQPEEQKQRATEELQAIAANSPARPVEQLRETYVQVEELALRAVQVAYNVPVIRQVVVAGRVRFDGAFTKDGSFHVVEVKYLPGIPQQSRIREALEQASKQLLDAGVSRGTIVMAVVLDDASHIPVIEAALPQITPFSAFPADVRLYSRSKLLFEYGPSLP